MKKLQKILLSLIRFLPQWITVTSLLSKSLTLSAQSNDVEEKNVVISNSQSEFRFVKGNTDNPVQVKETSRRSYTCNSYRTIVPFSEFYNSFQTIDGLSLYIDGSKQPGIAPTYEYYDIDGIFYSDAHVCNLPLNLYKKGSVSEIRFTRTTLDPRYFTTVFFNNAFEIIEQEIKIIVPSWMHLEVKEFNFEKYDISKQKLTGAEETTYIYKMRNIPLFRNEDSAPGLTYTAPHILVLCQSARPKDVEYTYFKTIKELYEWYKGLADQSNDNEKTVKEKAEEITAGLLTEEEKAKRIYQWVQDNIRYIAFEDGIAGFKPDRASEVLRKKYADCKGMANLLTQLLRSLNLDARRCWIGTRHIAYSQNIASLAVNNHMICVWMKKGLPVYLDATEKFIGFNEIAERIQGRETMIENGNQFLLEKIPVNSYLQNTSKESRKFFVEGNDLKGHVIQIWKGESKEWLLSALNDIKMDKQENVLKQYLSGGKQNFQVSDLRIMNISDYNTDLKIEYDVVWKDALTTFDNDFYIDLNNRRSLENLKIDTAKRRSPYWFEFKEHVQFETEIILPAGKSMEFIPPAFDVKRSGYSFNGSYVVQKERIIYKYEIIIIKTVLDPANFSQWNEDIDKLINFYNQQLVLSKKNSQ